jgi:DNA ligase-associated metallophosphoesterase
VADKGHFYMQAPLQHKIKGQNFWLSAQRCAFWEEQKALIFSDPHFGKTGHFRKAGIPVPQSVYKEDLQRMLALINYFGPQQVVIVGDLFHSRVNTELDLFKRWRDDVSHLSFKLIKGNHDILNDAWYKAADVELYQPELTVNGFAFTHDQCDAVPGAYSFCGHLHPGVVVHGGGRQSLRLPCFYFTQTHCILPAFGRFTGTANVRPSAEATIFAIAEDSLVQIF